MRRPLTSREKHYVLLVCQGKINKEIAHALSVKEGTVKVILNRISLIVGVSGRMALVMWAVRTGLYDPRLPVAPLADPVSERQEHRSIQ